MYLATLLIYSFSPFNACVLIDVFLEKEERNLGTFCVKW